MADYSDIFEKLGTNEESIRMFAQNLGLSVNDFLLSLSSIRKDRQPSGEYLTFLNEFGFDPAKTKTFWDEATKKKMRDDLKSFTGTFSANKQAYQDYLKLIKDQPGRKSTILTPMSGPEAKTQLGVQTSPLKTVLGG